MTEPDLLVRCLTKRYPNADTDLTAVADVSFDVARGEFFTLLGPSGCGKTTTLRMIAGLESVTSGTITYRGRDYATLPAQHRNIGMVFQSYALFPHLTVFENVAYGLRVRRTSPSDISARVRETLDLLQLTPLADRLPAQLSGGQQQRVSIARALVYRPDILLLDEPLANLDAKLRTQMREEIRRLQRRLGIMVLYVTHDQEEAMAISDRVAVFNEGRLVQIGRPADVYADPASLFVADFIGKANFFPVTPKEIRNRRAIVALPSGRTISLGRITSIPQGDASWASDGQTAIMMVRPERLIMSKDVGDISARVQLVQHLGSFVRYSLSTEGVPGTVTVDLGRPVEGCEEGADCKLTFNPEDVILYV